MNLADWEARLCLPREGYPPEVISCLSWGGRQERGQARAKAEKVPIRAPPAHPFPPPPRAHGLALGAREGTAGAVCPDRPVGRDRQGAGRGQLSHGVSPQSYPIYYGVS